MTTGSKLIDTNISVPGSIPRSFAAEHQIVDILNEFVLEIPCPNCGQLYQVQVSQVFLAQDVLAEGLTCRSEKECPPLHLASLLNRADLLLLRDTWVRLCDQARDHGAELLVARSTRSVSSTAEHHHGSHGHYSQHGGYFSPFEPTHTFEHAPQR